MSAYDRVRQLLDGEDAVLLDGAVGSELVRRGVRWRGHCLRTDPEAVGALHAEYIAAGADVIRTNTFQLNGRIYRNVFRDERHMRHIGAPGVETRAADLTRKAAGLARTAAESSSRDVAVAGVMAPLEHCFRPDLAPGEDEALEEHREIARWLAEGGVDLLLLESMNTRGEALAAARAAIDTGLPVWASFVLGPEGELLSGEPLTAAARAAEDLGVEVVLVNCTPPDDVTDAVDSLVGALSIPVGAFAQIGKFDPPSWKFEFQPRFSHTDEWPPERYADVAGTWREKGARVLGGCCGTGPDHIRKLREVV